MDAVEDAVDEAARLARAELLGDLDRLVDDDLRRRVRAPAELVDGETEDVAIDHGHPVEVPVLREARDDVVDLALARLRAADDRVGELARVLVEGMTRPELRPVRRGIALARQV